MEKKAVNRIKQPEKERKRVLPKFNFRLNIGGTAKGILGGEVLKNPTIKFYPYLIYLTLLGIVYIANNYNVESKIRQMNKLYAEIKELNAEYITGKANLEEMTKQSELAKKLEKTGIRESVEPLKLIKINKEKK
jgi:hypothetical protein